MADQKPQDTTGKDTTFTVRIDHPTEAQIGTLFPRLARLKATLEALGCIVTFQVDSVDIEIVEVKEHE